MIPMWLIEQQFMNQVYLISPILTFDSPPALASPDCSYTTTTISSSCSSSSSSFKELIYVKPRVTTNLSKLFRMAPAPFRHFLLSSLWWYVSHRRHFLPFLAERRRRAPIARIWHHGDGLVCGERRSKGLYCVGVLPGWGGKGRGAWTGSQLLLRLKRALSMRGDRSLCCRWTDTRWMIVTAVGLPARVKER